MSADPTLARQVDDLIRKVLDRKPTSVFVKWSKSWLDGSDRTVESADALLKALVQTAREDTGDLRTSCEAVVLLAAYEISRAERQKRRQSDFLARMTSRSVGEAYEMLEDLTSKGSAIKMCFGGRTY